MIIIVTGTGTGVATTDEITAAGTRRMTTGMTAAAMKDMATRIMATKGTATKAATAMRVMVRVATVTRVVTAGMAKVAVTVARVATVVKVAMAARAAQAAEATAGPLAAEAMVGLLAAAVTAEAVAAAEATAEAVADRAGTEASSAMGGSAGLGMPRYKCHKVVHALQISHVFGNEVHFVDGRHRPFRGEPGMFARYVPVSGDYLIFYGGADDYKSFSPRSTFEEGYSLFPEGEQAVSSSTSGYGPTQLRAAMQAIKFEVADPEGVARRVLEAADKVRAGG